MDKVNELIASLQARVERNEQIAINSEQLFQRQIDALRTIFNAQKTHFDDSINSSQEIKAILANFFEYAEDQKIALQNELSKFKSIIIAGEKIYNDINELNVRATELMPNISIVSESLDDARGSLDDANDLLSKSNAIHKSIQARKNDIDTVFYELNGQDQTNDEGVIYHTDGLTDQLRKSFKNWTEKIASAILSSEKQVEIFGEAIQKLNIDSKNKFIDFLESAEKERSRAISEIRALLPNALTAGLSSAYEQKRALEQEESAKQQIIFRNAIIALVCIALFPVLLNFYYIFSKNINIDDLLVRLPSEMSIMLPIYIPILWVANSANKKINLSKRLIEEYAHKEVLSKTFEGLSNQISEISTSTKTVADDLRIKLLYNLLEVSSENPGKLISDYRKGDHPLMDALEKSAKLGDAFEKLVKLPGFKGLAKMYADKAEKILDDQARKADLGISLEVDSTASQKTQ